MKISNKIQPNVTSSTIMPKIIKAKIWHLKGYQFPCTDHRAGPKQSKICLRPALCKNELVIYMKLGALRSGSHAVTQSKRPAPCSVQRNWYPIDLIRFTSHFSNRIVLKSIFYKKGLRKSGRPPNLRSPFL